MAALVQEKESNRGSRLFDLETESNIVSSTDRVYRERLQRYCMLLAKEREVLQKLERARRASTAGLQWMDSEPQTVGRTRTSSIDPKIIRGNEKVGVITRKCSMQVTRQASQTESSMPSRRLSQPIFPSQAAFPFRPTTPVEKTAPSVSEQRTPRTAMRKTFSSQTELTSSKIRVLESQRKSAQRMQRLQSLDEDCEKAKQLLKKYKSVSLSRLDLISSGNSPVADAERKIKSKSWLI